MKFILVFFVSVLWLAACSQSQVTTYPTYADAVADGAIAKGWVPSIVPVGARDISEVHNVEIDQAAVTFLASDREFLKALHPLPKKFLEMARDTFEAVDFSKGKPGDGPDYFYVCTEEGVGLLTGSVEPERFFYFESSEGKWAHLCGGR